MTALWKWDFIYKWNPIYNEYVPLELDMYQILNICSLLISSDIIAAISMINYNDQPKLFSIIYGEGVFNDIVSIILFKTMLQFDKNYKFTTSAPWDIFKTSMSTALFSIMVGGLAGMMSSLMFKIFRFFTHSAITETAVIYILAMIAYIIAEMLELSGLISLVSCGITMGHYTWYNLSPQGKTISSVSVSIFGAISESVVFTYIGLSAFTYANST